jgi:hypothetical protein
MQYGRRFSVGKVYGVHVVQFQPGANIEEYEQFYRDRVTTVRIPGMESHLVRADRGSDVGKYLELFEFESVEMRDQLFPVAGQPPPELLEQLRPILDEAARWLESGPDIYTDWVTVV